MSNSSLKPTDLAFQLSKAGEAIGLVIRQHLTLEQALSKVLKTVDHHSACGAITDLAFYALRCYGRGSELVKWLSGKPRLKPDLLVDFLSLCCALLSDLSKPKYSSHTLVDQAVKACKAHKKLSRASGLVNACLRNYLRDADAWQAHINQSQLAQWNFPSWWVKKLQQAYPEHWQSLLQQANEHPPMVLRVNRRVSDAEQYHALLLAEGIQSTVLNRYAVVLAEPVAVNQLPGFEQGAVSVQDAAAQMAVPLLNPQDGQRILDCCAAPGGKTGHILEWADSNVLALDIHAKRLQKVAQNYQRLLPTLGPSHGFEAKAVDANSLDAWWDGQLFDHVLADLPCTGSGVVRRHPEIRWLKSADQLLELSHIQHSLLNSLWSTLKPGGTLLLVTCSVFPEEGEGLVRAFLAQTPDAVLLPASPGVILPTQDFDDSLVVSKKSQRYFLSPDGFYYALLSKRL